MGDSRKSRGRLVDDPVSDTDLDAMVAEVYLAGGDSPDDAQIEFMRNKFRLLHEDESPFADVTHARSEESYIRKKFEAMLIWLYLTRVDRAIGLVIASGAVLIGLGALLDIITISTRVLQAGTIALIGVLVGAGVFESGRLGYLARMNWNHIDDLGASLSATVVRGHHRVHEEEQAMLRRARFGKKPPGRLMLVELWNGQRSSPGTKQSAAVEEEVDRLIRDYPECEVRSAFSATPDTWPQRQALLERRCGKIDQQFFIENPLQVDAVLTDDEAILSFPRGKGDRGLALVFQSKGIVEELWAVFDGQVGGAKTAESISIESPDDIQKAKSWVNDEERSVSAFPHSSF